MLPLPLKKGITNGGDEGLFCMEGKGNKDTHKDKGRKRKEPLSNPKLKKGNSPLPPVVILALSEQFRFMCCEKFGAVSPWCTKQNGDTARRDAVATQKAND